MSNTITSISNILITTIDAEIKVFTITSIVVITNIDAEIKVFSTEV